MTVVKCTYDGVHSGRVVGWWRREEYDMSVDDDFKKAEDKTKATQTVVKLTAKSVGYMDQGMGHGHYGWIPKSLTQEEFYDLHLALATLEALPKEKV